MATRIKTSLDLGPFYAYLRGVKRRSINFRPVFKAAMRELAKAHAKNFDSKGALVGGWAPNDTDYATWKLSEYGRGGVLVRTGALKNSLTRISNSRGAVRDIGLTSAEFGTAIEYAGYHQHGTDDFRARKIVFAPQTFAKDLGRDALDYLAYGAGPNGLIKRAKDV